MTDTRSPAASAPALDKPRAVLRRILSHHEIATLLLLLHAPLDLAAKPEIPLLQEAGLVEQVAADTGDTRFTLTPDGTAILRGLGVS